MATMEIHLRDTLKRRLAARAAESGFQNIEAYIQSLLEADAGEPQMIEDEDLERLLLARLNGDADIEVTPTFVRKFNQQVAQRRRAI